MRFQIPIDNSNYEFGLDKAKIVVPFYNAQASGFKGLKETVGFISLGGDVD